VQLHPYLIFNGQCREAFTFYQQCLGGTIESMFTHGETPIADQVSAEMQDRILHATLKVGEAVLMASDCPPERYEKPSGTYVSLNLDTPAEADRIYEALAENGSVIMPIGKTFWAERFAMLIDRFGTPWMLNCEAAA